MPVKYSRNSNNQDYNDLLKELGIINNTTSNAKKDIRLEFKNKKMLQTKYIYMT